MDVVELLLVDEDGLVSVVVVLLVAVVEFVLLFVEVVAEGLESDDSD